MSNEFPVTICTGITDIRNGFNGLAAKIQTALKDAPMSVHVFIFRDRSGSQVKPLWSTGDCQRLPGYPDVREKRACAQCNANMQTSVPSRPSSGVLQD
ncbi:hypothetical protein KOSB73_40140 [Klebsiella grimontii]|uniref:Transposase n=1 Tax=Klebsiella grimontii TaxID=2058152 RepID=A0A285B9E2_9ENTR|nr:hypothetical protein KOSB73_40140 [Klebsiella grimontii]